MELTEEKLWDFIDGNCTADEQKAIDQLIAQDASYKKKYEELLLLNQQFENIALDEPPMAFSYKVMESIRTENAKQPLIAAVNPLIVKGIATFFGITIIALLVYALLGTNWPAMVSSTKPLLSFKMPALQNYFSGAVVKGFLFFDIVLALYFFDHYFRKKLTDKNLI